MHHLLSVLIAAPALAAGLVFTTPDGWKPAATSSSMRVAQFVLPRAAGDTQDAELVVYYFGGSGGTIDANINRWVAQMQQPPGAVPVRAKRTVNGLAVTLVDVSGTYVAEMTPGSSQRHNSPNFRLRAAVVTPVLPHQSEAEREDAADRPDFQRGVRRTAWSEEMNHSWLCHRSDHCFPRVAGAPRLALRISEAYPRPVRRDPTSEIRRAGERQMTIAATGHHTARHRQG